MTFAYLNRYLFVAAVVALASPAFATEPKLDTELRCPLLKYLKELLSRYAAESVTT